VESADVHARTAMRRRLWLAGSAAATIGSAALAPAFGIVVGGAAAALLIGGAMRPSSDFYGRPLRRGAASSRRVALTFDDGPDAVRTPQVLDALREVNARATFFMIGRRVTEAPHVVRRALDEGHEIGAHSQTHDRTLPFRSRRRHTAEIRDCIAAISGAGAAAPRWYRPPMGYITPPLAEAIGKSPLRLVNWSLHSRDLADADEDRLVARVLARVRGGDVVLLHDGSDRHGAGPAAVPPAVRRIVRGLRERGLEPVTLSELFDECDGHSARDDARHETAAFARCGDRVAVHGDVAVAPGSDIPRPVLGDEPFAERAATAAIGLLARSIELAETVLHGVPLPVQLVPPSIIRDGPVIFVANHRSLLDTPFLRWTLPREIKRRLVTVGGYDFFEPRGRGWSRRLQGAFLRFIVHGYRVWMIDRRLDGAAGAAQLAPLAHLIEAGWSLLLYPEGRRSRTARMGSMHPGAAILAIRTGARIVPLFMSGSERVLPPGVTWPRGAPLRVRAGEPMRPHAGERPEAFMFRVRAAIAAISDGEESAAPALERGRVEWRDAALIGGEVRALDLAAGAAATAADAFAADASPTAAGAADRTMPLVSPERAP